ncbi:MAG: uridine-cytidine kinase [Pseudomonadota bacterium]
MPGLKFIGIAGASGSGKGEVSKKIEEKLGARCLTISMDWFYKHFPEKSEKERAAANYDIPDSLDWNLLLEKISELKAGKELVELPGYEFATHLRKDVTTKVNPADYDTVIIDGILLFTNADVLKELDLKVYVHADQELCLVRRVFRDVEERGRDALDVLNQYLKYVRPAFYQYILPTRTLPGVIEVSNNLRLEDIIMTNVFEAIDNLLNVAVNVIVAAAASTVTYASPRSPVANLTTSYGKFRNGTPSPTPVPACGDTPEISVRKNSHS